MADNINGKLAKIQQSLNAPKGQFNKFGKYNYRNCEDILEALKPLLADCTVVISDDIQAIGDRVYVKATAVFSDGKESVMVTAFARESLTKKGMDDSQITGSTSSYARKYALNGLFLIDDNKDADSQDNSAPAKSNEPVLSDQDKQWIAAVKNNPEVLNAIEDVAYRALIKKEANK